MNLGIDNRFAIICASSKGLGFAIADSLLHEKARVLICSSKKTNLEKAKEILVSKGFNNSLYTFHADLSTTEGVKELFEFALTKSINIDILVNNCGGPDPGDIELLNENDLNNAINRNLKNVFNLTKLVLPIMQKNNWGRIVNITSSSAKQPIDGLLLSNITRPAITGFAKSISNQYAKYNILVNNVLPGRIITDRITQLAEKKSKETGVTTDEVIKAMGKDVPIGRLGTPDEFASIVTFLCSEQASYITGNSIHVDGVLIKSIF